MTREELEKAVADIMLADVALLQDYEKVDIIRAIMLADTETLKLFLEK